MKKIGLVGAGIMASGMANNYLKHGNEVYVWNRSEERLKPLETNGAKICESPREVAEKSDIIVECVSDDEASRSVWLGKDGILAGASPDKTLITSATVSIKWIDELAEMCQKQSLQFVDMPLSGGRRGAENGQLWLLCGGEKKLVDDLRSELEPIARVVCYFGKAGSGIRFKLLLNTLSAIHINAAAQAVMLARKAGLDPEEVGKVWMDDLGPASPATNLLLQGMDKGEEHMTFAVKWLEKDLRYARRMAEAYGIDFDLLNDTQKDYEKAMDEGLSERDWTAIIELYRKNL